MTFKVCCIHCPHQSECSEDHHEDGTYERLICSQCGTRNPAIFDMEIKEDFSDERFQDKFNNWYDPIYFSWITMTSTGYGDISPTSGYGKFTVCLQIFIFLVSMVVFTILSLEKDILKPSFKKCRS